MIETIGAATALALAFGTGWILGLLVRDWRSERRWHRAKQTRDESEVS